MISLNFKKVNLLAGWGVFLISSIVYILTVEPTVSFWDCGEFILSAWKLQVGHPPGAPFFLILGRVFSLFSFGDQTKAALMINLLSAIASAFTVMFLYWTIVHLVRNSVVKDGENPGWSILLPIIASGVIGSLGYAFSDTFWFSAVEGEVYATSSLFTAIVFWAILRWESDADKKYSGRWLVLIAYLMGLSIGVHLLNLLALPAIVLVFYFKNYNVSAKGILKALGVSAIMLFLLVFILLPYTVKIAGWFELFFINSVGLPYNSGLYIYLVILISTLVLGIRYTIRKRAVVLNYAVTLLAVIMIGYSSIALIMIRANASPPMNQNNPSDLFSMIYYVNREQYGSAPLFKGQYYSAPIVDVSKKRGGYIKTGKRYEDYQRNNYKYDKRFTTFFPRMYSEQESHISEYRYWGDITGKKVSIQTANGPREYTIPTFSENLKFFFRYQVGYMYWRYFMWNFAGRQNDIQGNGNVLHGNWISGFQKIDDLRLGTGGNIPDTLKNNPARNRYFFLPLIFGIAGMVWQFRRRKNSFWVVLTLFIMTGLAIVVYLNQYPLQPRERDYAYSGSFYAFAIWIGMGFYLIYEALSKLLKRDLSLLVSFVISIVAVPLLLAYQNWDDHDRSGRYTARDIGSNYLNSCDENAILFTYGDNDSFPVWYAQDVEGIRTDVRVANLSYLNAGWYIDMMRQKAYDSEPLPLSLGSEKYYPGSREQLPVVEQVKRAIDIREVLEFVALDDKQAKHDFTGRGDLFNYIPVRSFIIPVDTVKVIASGMVDKSLRSRLTDEIIWEYPGREMYKSDLVIMDILGTNEWNRPIYYATTVPPDNYNGLDKFFQMQGLAYKIVPVDTSANVIAEYGEIDIDKMFDNLMNRFKWGNANDPEVYLDENNIRMFNNFRRMFGILATELISEGDLVRAGELIKRCEEVIPGSKVPYGYYTLSILDACFAINMEEEALEIAQGVIGNSMQTLDYILNLSSPHRYGLDLEIALNMESLRGAYSLAVKYNQKDLIDLIEPNMDIYYNELYGRPVAR